MPTGDRKPTSASLGDVLKGLLEAGVDFTKLFAFLKSVEAVHRRLDDKLIEPKKRDLLGKGHVLLKIWIGPLDILEAIEGGRSYEGLLEHTIEIDFRGHRPQVLGLKTLIEVKKISTDPNDNQRLPVLKETLRQLVMPSPRPEKGDSNWILVQQ